MNSVTMLAFYNQLVFVFVVVILRKVDVNNYSKNLKLTAKAANDCYFSNYLFISFIRFSVLIDCSAILLNVEFDLNRLCRITRNLFICNLFVISTILVHRCMYSRKPLF